MTKQDWIALGGPSPLAKWGFELMHSIVELCAPQRQIHTIGRDDHVTLDPAHQTKSLWLAQFQNRPIVDVLATGHCRIVAFLDEPLEGLAPIIVEELLTALKTITRREGISAIIVEQHPRLILSISDQALVLERGQVVLQERAEVLLSQPDLLERLLGVQ